MEKQVIYEGSPSQVVNIGYIIFCVFLVFFVNFHIIATIISIIMDCIIIYFILH